MSPITHANAEKTNKQTNNNNNNKTRDLGSTLSKQGFIVPSSGFVGRQPFIVTGPHQSAPIPHSHPHPLKKKKKRIISASAIVQAHLNETVKLSTPVTQKVQATATDCAFFVLVDTNSRRLSRANKDRGKRCREQRENPGGGHPIPRFAPSDTPFRPSRHPASHPQAKRLHAHANFMWKADILSGAIKRQGRA